jgi:3-deoxy-D-manno-octulosonic-acid transferase
MNRLLYNLLLPFAWLLLHGPGRLLPRLRENLAARRGLFGRLERALADAPPGSKRRVWIHCASLGEFEAIRPLARRLRAGGDWVALSFFSTSGPRNLQGEIEADLVEFLPLDTPRSARRWTALLRPQLALVTKHDLWPNHLRAAHRSGARLVFANANFHSRSRLRMPLLRGLHREVLADFELIAPVSELAASRFRELLAGLPPRIEPLGEMRFDRVVERALASPAQERLPVAFRGAGVWVAGSSWQPDEELLLPVFAALAAPRGQRLVLVPHEPSPEYLAAQALRLSRAGLSALRLSELEAGRAYAGESVLIVDRVGLLAGLYRGAWLAWVGGGFTTGVHSVIEPAAFGVPVLFGPRHHVSQEAEFLLADGGGFSIEDQAALRQRVVLWLADEAARHQAGDAARRRVEACTGATDRLLERLRPL